MLAEASRHLIEAGGKRLRPCLTMMACEAVGGRFEDALETATAMELLHTFSIIHDDIMDRGEIRRNVRTVHRTWGEPIAIVTGDALFAKVFEILTVNAKRLRLSGGNAIDLIDTVSRASFELCRGQALDSLLKERVRVSEEEYLEMAGGKTGALFEASAKAGGLLGGGGKDEVRALAGYGRSFGLAFQIQDDVLSLTGERGRFGKPIGGDIVEGKRSLPVVYALGILRKKDRSKLLRALGDRRISKDELGRITEMLKESGAIDKAIDKARGFVSGAKSELGSLRESEAKRALFSLADFAVERGS